MINILVLKSKQNIVAIEATGHSGYAESGSDIVCSAVSTLLESLINGLIEVLKINPDYTIDEETPFLKVALKDLSKEKMRDAQILMNSTFLGLKGVEDSYKKFIKIKEKQND